MKKAYVVISLLSIIALAGCTLKAPQTPEVSTWEILTWTDTTWTEFTGIVDTWSISTMEELTWEFDSEEVPMVEGSVTITTGENTVATRLKNLFNKRNAQPKDDTKLIEEDIDLMQEVIQKVQDLWK